MADTRPAGEGSERSGEPKVPAQDQPVSELARLIAESDAKGKGFWRRRKRKSASTPTAPTPQPEPAAPQATAPQATEQATDAQATTEKAPSQQATTGKLASVSAPTGTPEADKPTTDDLATAKTSDQPAVKQPAEPAADQPTTEKPVDPTADKPAAATTGKPADATSGKPADATTGKPADPAADAAVATADANATTDAAASADADNSPTDQNKPTGATPTDPTAADSTDAEPTDAEPADTQANDIHATDTHATDTHATDGQATDGQATETQATETQATDGQATDGQVAGAEVAGSEPTTAQQTDAESADGQASDVQATDGQPADGEQLIGAEKAADEQSADQSPTQVPAADASTASPTEVPAVNASAASPTEESTDEHRPAEPEPATAVTLTAEEEASRPKVGVVYEPDESAEGFPLEYGDIIIGLPKQPGTPEEPTALRDEADAELEAVSAAEAEAAAQEAEHHLQPPAQPEAPAQPNADPTTDTPTGPDPKAAGPQAGEPTGDTPAESEAEGPTDPKANSNAEQTPTAEVALTAEPDSATPAEPAAQDDAPAQGQAQDNAPAEAEAQDGAPAEAEALDDAPAAAGGEQDDSAAEPEAQDDAPAHAEAQDDASAEPDADAEPTADAEPSVEVESAAPTDDGAVRTDDSAAEAAADAEAEASAPAEGEPSATAEDKTADAGGESAEADSDDSAAEAPADAEPSASASASAEGQPSAVANDESAEGDSDGSGEGDIDAAASDSSADADADADGDAADSDADAAANSGKDDVADSAADAAAESGGDDAADSAADANTHSTADADAADATKDDVADSGVDAGTDSGADAGTDSDSDSGTDADSDADAGVGDDSSAGGADSGAAAVDAGREKSAEEVATEQAAMALITALMKLRGALAASRLPIDVVGADEARQQQKAMLDQLDDYVLPRLVQLEAPVLAVVGGSTGAGKSTLVNSIIGQVVSEPGVLRPTTRSPVLIHHPADVDWFTNDRVLPGMARSSGDSPGGMEDPGQIRLVAADTIPQGLAILDAPDIDSVVEANRDLATQLLAAADLWLFVTTAARYADAVPWEFLQSASDRSTAVAVVLDRAPSDTIDDITGHLAQMLLERGLGDSPLFSIKETVVDGNGMLAGEVVASIKDWLIDLAADAEARSGVVRRTLQGAVTAMTKKTPAFAKAVRAQADTVVELRSTAESAYDQAVQDIAKATEDGTMLRGEVLARWQEFVGTGELLKGLQTNVGRLRDKVRTAVVGNPPPTRDLKDAIESGLESLLREHAAAGAERAEAAWQASAPGRQLLAAGDPGMGGMSEEFPDAAGRAVREWQEGVFELIRQEGADKRSTARILAYGENGLGLALMISIFASTASVPAGSKATTGVSTAVVGQRLLDAVFGEEAVRGLAAKARDDLDARVHALMDAEFARYLAVLDQHPVDPDAPRQLTEAARAVEDCT
ncbi:dynamin family protein [Kribbella sp. NPDC051620]|uniref:dynamin family protein n=1 Tax=Kribbella sp. NPDC051620 TaxID=3364120 RepID=UPI0037B1E934